MLEGESVTAPDSFLLETLLCPLALVVWGLLETFAWLLWERSMLLLGGVGVDWMGW